MKFKRPNDYAPAVAETPKPTPAPAAPPAALQVQEVHQWECVACQSRAVVLHKGTGYCRTHYDTRAYSGNLIN